MFDVAAAFDLFNTARLQSPTLEKLWSESFGDDYATEAKPNAFYPQQALDQIANDYKQLDPSSAGHGTLLDLGCGHGLVGEYMAKRLGLQHLIGVDISPKSIEMAAKRAPEGLTTNFLVASGESVPLVKDSSCDIIICMDVMLYFRDKPATFKEIVRCLKPGGMLAFTTWEQQSGHNDRIGAMQYNDYRPLIKDAGLETQSYEEVPRAKQMQETFFDLIANNKSEISGDVGDQVANMWTMMAAAAAQESPKRRYVLAVASKP